MKVRAIKSKMSGTGKVIYRKGDIMEVISDNGKSLLVSIKGKKIIVDKTEIEYF
jgi:hypothetical protein